MSYISIVNVISYDSDPNYTEPLIFKGTQTIARWYNARTFELPKPILSFDVEGGGISSGAEGDASPDESTFAYSIAQIKKDGVTIPEDKRPFTNDGEAWMTQNGWFYDSGRVYSVQTGSDNSVFLTYRGPFIYTLPIGDNAFYIEVTGATTHDSYLSADLIILSPNDTTPPIMTLRNLTGHFHSPNINLEVNLFDDLAGPDRIEGTLNGTPLPPITTFPSNITIQNSGPQELVLYGYDKVDNQTEALTYKFDATAWTGDTLKTIRNIKVSSGASSITNALGLVYFYEDSITTTTPVPVDEALLETGFYANDVFLDMPNVTLDAEGLVNEYTILHLYNGGYSNTTFVDVKSLSSTSIDYINFLKGDENIDKNLYMLAAMVDSTVPLTIEEVCETPTPVLEVFNVVSPQIDSNGVYNFYNPIVINTKLASITNSLNLFSLNNQFYKISYNNTSDIQVGYAYAYNNQIAFLPDSTDTVATIDFFNVCGDKVTRTLNVNALSINVIPNPSDPLTGTTVGQGATPVNGVQRTGSRPNYHNRLVIR